MLMNKAEAQLFLSLMFAAFADNELVANKAAHLLIDLASSQFNKTKQSACAKQEHFNDKLTHYASRGFKSQITISFAVFVGYVVLNSVFQQKTPTLWRSHDFCHP